MTDTNSQAASVNGPFLLNGGPLAANFDPYSRKLVRWNSSLSILNSFGKTDGLVHIHNTVGICVGEVTRDELNVIAESQCDGLAGVYIHARVLKSWTFVPLAAARQALAELEASLAASRAERAQPVTRVSTPPGDQLAVSAVVGLDASPENAALIYDAYISFKNDDGIVNGLIHFYSTRDRWLACMTVEEFRLAVNSAPKADTSIRAFSDKHGVLYTFNRGSAVGILDVLDSTAAAAPAPRVVAFIAD